MTALDPIGLACYMSDAQLQTIAANIRRVVGRSGLSASDIARELGVDRSAVSRWMSGERVPIVQHLIELAKLLDIEVTELWDGGQAEPATPEQKGMLALMARMSPQQQQALLALAAATAGFNPE